MVRHFQTPSFHLFVLVGVFIAAGLLTEEIASAQQPNSRQGPLWNLARKACSGERLAKTMLGDLMSLSHPVYYFREQPKPVELLVISTQHCPEPLGEVVFVVGHLSGGQGKGLYYKISSQSEGIMQASQSYWDEKLQDVIYQMITPTSQVGGRNVYPKNIQDDYNSLMAVVIAKWGR